MPKTYKTHCASCGRYYEGRGKYYCSSECKINSLQGKPDSRFIQNSGWKKLLEKFQPDMEDDTTIKVDECIVCGDFHMPYVNIDFFEKMLKISELYTQHPRSLFIIGDLIDFESISYWGTKQKDSTVEKDVEGTRLVLNVMLNTFEQIYYVIGNHEERIMRKLDWFFTSSILGDMILSSNKLKLIEFPFVNIVSNNTTFRCTHPKNYSRIGSVPIALATKYRVSVLGFHGHLFSMRTDPSGIDIGYDVGCMTDQSLHSYVRHNDTNHPYWINGFTMIKDGTVYPFTNNNKITNWKFWLEDLPNGKVVNKSKSKDLLCKL